MTLDKRMSGDTKAPEYRKILSQTSLKSAVYEEKSHEGCASSESPEKIDVTTVYESGPCKC
jgi:hypothetical protein